MLKVVAAVLRGAQRGALSSKHGNKHYFKGEMLRQEIPILVSKNH